MKDMKGFLGVWYLQTYGVIRGHLYNSIIFPDGYYILVNGHLDVTKLEIWAHMIHDVSSESFIRPVDRHDT